MEAGQGFSLPATRSYSDGHSIACLILFLVAACVTVRPIIIPITLPESLGSALYTLRLRNDQLLKRRTYHLAIDLNVGPLAAVLVLLASKSIGIVEFRAGIKGRGDLHPYDILLLFLSLVRGAALLHIQQLYLLKMCRLILQYPWIPLVHSGSLPFGSQIREAHLAGNCTFTCSSSSWCLVESSAMCVRFLWSSLNT